MRTLSAALLCALICGCAPVGEDERGAMVTFCELLPEVQCIESPRCTLDLVRRAERWYACRDSLDRCEKGFLQAEPLAETCEEKPGCRFVEPRCYCAPAVVCVCGGGPPAQCVLERNTAPSRP